MVKYRIHIDKESYPWETKLYIRRCDADGRLSYCQGIEGGNLIFKRSEPGEVIPPLFSIPFGHNDEGSGLLKAFATELTRLGIKPTESQQSEKELDATKRHLSDMRLITFKKLDINGQPHQE